MDVAANVLNYSSIWTMACYPERDVVMLLDVRTDSTVCCKKQDTPDAVTSEMAKALYAASASLRSMPRAMFMP